MIYRLKLIQILDLNIGKRTRDAFLISLAQITSNSQAIGDDALLIINNSILVIMSTYYQLFDNILSIAVCETPLFIDN